MMKVQQTKDYDIFELSSINRKIISISKLKSSMIKHGWIDAYPMHVNKGINNVLVIKDGHHRFMAAKSLDIPVKFIICNDEASVGELVGTIKVWNPKDFIESHSRAGNPNYFAIIEYSEATGISYMSIASMLYGHLASSHNCVDSIKDGTYKTRENVQSSIVRHIVIHMRNAGLQWASARVSVFALSQLSFVHNFDSIKMINKITTFKSTISLQATLKAMLREYENLYNRSTRNADKLPLSLLALQESARRATGGRKV
jgi:hypothetical protein